MILSRGKPSATACRTVIAGRPIHLEVDDPALARALAGRYAAFAGDGDDATAPPVCVGVRTLDPVPGGPDRDAPSSPCWRPVFEGGRAVVRAPSARGVIDIRSGRAELSLCSPRPVEDADYFLRLTVALCAFDRGGVLLHAAGIVRGGAAHVFFGPSGSGKSTVTRLSDGARVLSDDLVVLMPGGGGWAVHATPFSNPGILAKVGPGHAPLAALYRLVKDRQVSLEPMGAGSSAAELVASAPVVNTDRERLPALLARLAALAAAIPVWSLRFRPDPSFWQVCE